MFLKGIRVSNSECIGVSDYTLTPTADPFVINAVDSNGVEMTLRREEGHECFTTHWISNGFHYLGYFDKNIMKSI